MGRKISARILTMLGTSISAAYLSNGSDNDNDNGHHSDNYSDNNDM